MFTKRRIILLIAAVLLTATVAVGIIVGAESIPPATSGTCGNEATWSFSEDGTLTISGIGMTFDQRTEQMPWYPLKDKITKVVIEEGITHLGELSFYGFDKITEVSLPDYLVSVGRYAFFECK